MIEIYIVRHGQTEDNVKRMIAGQLPGKLTDLGRKQAIQTGKHLANIKFTHAFVSDLTRTVDTFNEISKSMPNATSIEVNYEPLLREKHGGVLHGESLDLPKKLAQEQGLTIRQFRPEKGESWEDVYVRAQKFMEKIAKLFLKREEKEEETADKRPAKVENKADKAEPLEVEEEERKADEKPKLEDLEKKQAASKEGADEIKSKVVKAPAGDLAVKRKGSKQLEGKAPIEKDLGLTSKKIVPSVIKEKKSVLKTSSEKAGEIKTRLLVVTHGGFIMETYNFLNFHFFDIEPAFRNDSSNCSIHILQMHCKKTQGKCSDSCKDFSCVSIKIIKRNDDSHIKLVKEQHK